MYTNLEIIPTDDQQKMTTKILENVYAALITQKLQQRVKEKQILLEHLDSRCSNFSKLLQTLFEVNQQ
jgi:hypothetical protein